MIPEEEGRENLRKVMHSELDLLINAIPIGVLLNCCPGLTITVYNPDTDAERRYSAEFCDRADGTWFVESSDSDL